MNDRQDSTNCVRPVCAASWWSRDLWPVGRPCQDMHLLEEEKEWWCCPASLNRLLTTVFEPRGKLARTCNPPPPTPPLSVLPLRSLIHFELFFTAYVQTAWRERFHKCLENFEFRHIFGFLNYEHLFNSSSLCVWSTMRRRTQCTQCLWVRTKVEWKRKRKRCIFDRFLI